MALCGWPWVPWKEEPQFSWERLPRGLSALESRTLTEFSAYFGRAKERNYEK